MNYNEYMMESVCSALDELVGGGTLTESQADQVFDLACEKYNDNKADRSKEIKKARKKLLKKIAVAVTITTACGAFIVWSKKYLKETKSYEDLAKQVNKIHDKLKKEIDETRNALDIIDKKSEGMPNYTESKEIIAELYRLDMNLTKETKNAQGIISRVKDSHSKTHESNELEKTLEKSLKLLNDLDNEEYHMEIHKNNVLL